MKDRIKNFFSDYWPSIVAVFLFFLGLGKEIIEIQNLNFPLVTWIKLLLILVLAIIQIVKPQRELNAYKNSRPKIEVSKTFIRKNVPTTDIVRKDRDSDTITDRYSGGTLNPHNYLPLYRSMYGSTDNSETEIIEQTYALVEFVNNPATKRAVHNAERVVAHITYNNEKNENLLRKEITGFWSQNPEPSLIHPPQTSYSLTEIDIPANKNERTLCIALKNRAESDCYAYNSESYSNSVLLKRPDMNLGVGTILVKVVLTGVYLDDVTFWFRLVNPGLGRDITITKIDR